MRTKAVRVVIKMTASSMKKAFAKWRDHERGMKDENLRCVSDENMSLSSLPPPFHTE